MTNDQVQEIKRIAEKHGFELYDISEVSSYLIGRYDEAPEDVEEFVTIQAELDAANSGLHFSALELMSVNDITSDTPERIARRLRKGYKAGQKSLKKAGF